MKAVATIAAAIGILGVLMWIWRAVPSQEGATGGPERPLPDDTSAVGREPGGAADSSVDRVAESSPGSGPAHDRAFNCSSKDFLPERDSGKSDAELIEEFRERLFKLTDTLAASVDLEHRLTASLLKTSDEMPDAIDAIERLLPAMPQNPILHWRLLDACDARPGYPLCASGEAEARVIATLGANGEAWAKIAHYRIKRGDDAAGLEALLNASAAAEFLDYSGAETELVFRSLTIETNRPVPERLIESTGIAATFPKPELKLVNQCLLRASESPDWQRACTAYGLRKEADSRSAIGKSIGLSLQDAMQTAAGQAPDPAKARARDRQMLALYRDAAAQDGVVLLHYDENIGLAWLQRLVNDGEFAAYDFLRSEVARVRLIPGYDPCPPAIPQF